MSFVQNKSLEFYDIDDDNMVIYDSDNGDIHYLSGTGRTILFLLSQELRLDDLVSKLCKIYDTSKEEIEHDVQTFMDELIKKKVVLSL